MSDLVIGVVLLPLAGAVVAGWFPRIAAWVGLLVTALTAVMAVLIAVTVASHGRLERPLSGWEPPWGIMVAADGLAALMLVLTAGVGLAVCVAATVGAEVTGGRWFWPLWLYLLAGLNAVHVAADLFNTYVALELLTVGAAGLVALGGRSAQDAALRYLLVAVLGSLLFLVGVALVYAETGVLATAEAAELTDGGHVLLVAIAAMTIGLAIKTAVFPFHAWLPPAHAGAPAVVSPLLSALVVKASLVVLVRTWSVLADDAASVALATVLGVLGSVAVVWGGVLALRATTIKRVVAYSTVAQMGFLVLYFPLAIGVGETAAELAWRGMWLFALAHGLAKGAMFLAAGALATGQGSGNLTDLRGAAHRAPVAVLAFALAGVSLAGLPPALGFVGKWEMLRAALDAGQWWWILVLLGGGLLTFAYTARVLHVLLAAPEEEHAGGRRSALVRIEVAALVLAVATLVLGVRSVELSDLLMAGSPLGVR